MGLRDASLLIEADNRRMVMRATWGHLAPKKNKVYKGRIIYAIGCWDSGDLNPTPIVCDFKNLKSSPWFYDAVNEFLQDLEDQFREERCIFEWTGTFCNYIFEGNIKKIIEV